MIYVFIILLIKVTKSLKTFGLRLLTLNVVLKLQSSNSFVVDLHCAAGLEERFGLECLPAIETDRNQILLVPARQINLQSVE
jgi:hypothetical protein